MTIVAFPGLLLFQDTTSLSLVRLNCVRSETGLGLLRPLMVGVSELHGTSPPLTAVPISLACDVCPPRLKVTAAPPPSLQYSRQAWGG